MLWCGDVVANNIQWDWLTQYKKLSLKWYMMEWMEVSMGWMNAKRFGDAELRRGTPKRGLAEISFVVVVTKQDRQEESNGDLYRGFWGHFRFESKAE